MAEPVDSTPQISDLELSPNVFEEKYAKIWKGVNHYIGGENLDKENQDKYTALIRENFDVLTPALTSGYRLNDTLVMLRLIGETIKDKDSSQMALGVIADNIGTIKEQIVPNHPNPTDNLAALYAVNTLREHGNSDQFLLAQKIMDDSFDIVKEGLKLDSYHKHGYIPLLSAYDYFNPNSEKAQWVESTMLGLFTDKNFEASRIGWALGVMIKKENTEARAFAWKIVGLYLRQIGFNTSETLEIAADWATQGKKIHKNIEANIAYLAIIEEGYPGIAKFAYTHLGVKRFAIYQGDSLISRYVEYKENERKGLGYYPWTKEKRKLKAYGLDADSLLDAWKEGNPEMLRAVEQNIGRIDALEYSIENQGVTKALYEEFGIKYFARYPLELLERQYKESTVDLPYGVVLYPKSDHNGAFTENEAVFSKLNDAIAAAGYTLRVVECESKQDIARALVKLSKRYGEKHKISFAIVGGHGSENSIKFGGVDKRHTLYAQDLVRPRIKRSSEFFEPNPTIILVSCSTGVDKGVGEQLSDSIGAKVIAPIVPANIKSIHVLQVNGRLDFKVEYYKEGATNVFNPKAKNVN